MIQGWTEYTMQRAIARRLNFRQNMIIPNVFYPHISHECDLLVVTKSGYMTEIEIKITLADFRKDANKQYRPENIKYFYYAVPEELEEKVLPELPKTAGLIVIYEGKYDEWLKPYYANVKLQAPLNKGAMPLNESQKADLGRLCSIKLWSFKEKRFEENLEPIEDIEFQEQIFGDEEARKNLFAI